MLDLFYISIFPAKNETGICKFGNERWRENYFLNLSQPALSSKVRRELRETLSVAHFSSTQRAAFSFSLLYSRLSRLRWPFINMEISLMEKCAGESHARKRPAIKIAL